MNGQVALSTEGFSQTVVSGSATEQVNNNASVRLDDSQNHVQALSVANVASSAANVGQNMASVEVAEAAAFLQLTPARGLLQRVGPDSGERHGHEAG